MKIIIPWTEIEWTATRSSGAGGQHVNRTNSAVQLRFSVNDSIVLTESHKEKIKTRLSHRLTLNAEILIRIEDERDQKSNKDRAYELLNLMIQKALIDPKKRIATKPKRSSIQKRLNTKKSRSEIKKNRNSKIDY